MLVFSADALGWHADILRSKVVSILNFTFIASEAISKVLFT
jgi:D-serine dehydratase